MALSIMGRPVRFSLKWLKPPEMPPDGSMTLFEHLRELRYRLVVAAVAIIVAMIVCAFFYQEMYQLLLYPYEQAKAALEASKPGLKLEVVNIGIAAPFSLAMKITLVAGLVLSGPVWLYQIWSFVVPGLLAKEKKWALVFVAAASPLFAAGVLLGYFIMPKGIAVLVGFTPEAVDTTNMLNVTDFLSFLIRVMLVFGVAFLIPVFVLMLNFLGVIKASQLAKARLYVVFGTFVFGAVATPSTDPISMLALAIPMSLLFLAAEVIAHISDRRKSRRVVDSDLAVAASVENDRALQELDEGKEGA
ncbi:MAG: twin-arginine translocase subunit TatC [Propionibacteriaceae bacterium]